jgi:transposase
MAAIFVAEIGGVHRFPTARHVCSWDGLTPKHIESDTKVIRGRVTRMGSALVRWTAVDAVARDHGGPAISPAWPPPELLALVLYGMRDRRVRCLQEAR